MKIQNFKEKVMSKKDILIQSLESHDLSYFLNDRDGIVIIYHCDNIPKDVLQLIAQNGYSLQSA